jgi:cell division protein FtsZ
MTMEEFDEASSIIHDKVHEDANIIIGLVINEEMGERIKITAIATGFGDSFEKGRRNVEELRSRAGAGLENENRDLPTFIRDRQKDSPKGFRTPLGEEHEYDIPTFMRKRVD